MHTLGYFIDIYHTKFLETLKRLEESRNQRNDKYIRKFHEKGIELTMDEVKKYATGNIIGKPHFAKALLEKGYIQEYPEAFSNYFSKEEFKSIRREGLSPKEVIDLIRNAGGIPVLAHPKSLRLEGKELEEKILELKNDGLMGIECYYSYHTLEQMQESMEIAKRNNLLITGGTDFHGELLDPELKMGTGIHHNVMVPEEVVQHLQDAKKKIERRDEHEL